MHTITDVKSVTPADLLVDVNVRADLRLSKEFVASIKDHGVLSPIVAISTSEGLRVRQGHRRTAAAVEAGLDSVPVVIIDSEAEGDAAEVERLLTQHAENHHRDGLTPLEDAKVAQQLSLLGLSPTQIARRTHTKKAAVEAGLKVAGSDLASKATERYDLTLDQAVVVAEFEDDAETVKGLVVAAKEGKFDHVAQVARDARTEAEAKAPVIAALTEQGVTVIDARPRYADDARALDSLVDGEGKDLDPDQHAECPGHAVYLTEVETYTEPDGTVLDINRWGYVNEWPEGKEPTDEDEAEQRVAAAVVSVEWVPAAVCLSPAENGHMTHNDWYESKRRPVPASEKSDAEREADRAARRLVIDNNKAWKAAREVRREWVKTYLTRKTAPPVAGPFIAKAIARDAHLIADTGANAVAADWFGVETATYGRAVALTDLCGKGSDKRAWVLTLGQVLAGYEHNAGDTAWRSDGTTSTTGAYLRFLTDLGYTLSEVEEFAISETTA